MTRIRGCPRFGSALVPRSPRRCEVEPKLFCETWSRLIDTYSDAFAAVMKTCFELVRGFEGNRVGKCFWVNGSLTFGISAPVRLAPRPPAIFHPGLRAGTPPTTNSARYATWTGSIAR